jgi:hypothetical protein
LALGTAGIVGRNLDKKETRDVSTTTPRDDRGSRKRRGLGWLLALALVIVIAILLLARSCGGDDDNNGSSGGSAAVGTIMAGGKDLLAQASGSLSGVSGKSVSANAVAVQSVVNDSGFWAGTSKTDRVFVETEATGSGTKLGLQPGDKVSFDGTIEKNKEAETYGLRANQGAQQFRNQGFHVRVQAKDVKKV